jgi:hypothetical protein
MRNLYPLFGGLFFYREIPKIKQNYPLYSISSVLRSLTHIPSALKGGQMGSKRSVKNLILEDAVLAILRESGSLLSTKELATKCGTLNESFIVICTGNHDHTVRECVLTGLYVEIPGSKTSMPSAVHYINRKVYPRDLYPILARLVRNEQIQRVAVDNHGSVGWMLITQSDEVDLEKLWQLSQ